MQENPERVKEQQLEFYLKPIKELLTAETFARHGGNTLYYVTVNWNEPSEKGQWKPYSAFGLLDENFLAWATRHYEYWLAKAHVPLEIVKIEKLSQDPKKTLGW